MVIDCILQLSCHINEHSRNIFLALVPLSLIGNMSLFVDQNGKEIEKSNRTTFISGISSNCHNTKTQTMRLYRETFLICLIY